MHIGTKKIFLPKIFLPYHKNTYFCSAIGKMAEWSNVSHSKCDVGVTLPGVRIPLFPLNARSFRFGLFYFTAIFIFNLFFFKIICLLATELFK